MAASAPWRSLNEAHVGFLSRKKHKLHGFQDLRTALTREVNAEEAVLDGELAITDHTGRTILASMHEGTKTRSVFCV